MRRFFSGWALCCALAAAPAVAQDSVDVLPPPAKPRLAPSDASTYLYPGISPSENPELWLYLHEQRRYDDPQQAVRRNAELRDAQRRSRIAARKWSGYDPLRPAIYATPYFHSNPPVYVTPYWDPYYFLTPRYPSSADVQQLR